jgi:hypothetical protein
MPVSEHLRERTREWLHKADHDLTFPADPSIVISIDEAKDAIAMAKQLRGFVEQRLIVFGYFPSTS